MHISLQVARLQAAGLLLSNLGMQVTYHTCWTVCGLGLNGQICHIDDQCSSESSIVVTSTQCSVGCGETLELELTEHLIRANKAELRQAAKEKQQLEMGEEAANLAPDGSLLG